MSALTIYLSVAAGVFGFVTNYYCFPLSNWRWWLLNGVFIAHAAIASRIAGRQRDAK